MTVYNDQISQYIGELFAVQDQALHFTWEDSARQGLPKISVRPEEGRFLQFLVRACGARRAVEIGTLGGYSGIWIARGLPPEGKLYTLEIEPRHAEVARQHFQRAGVSERVEIRIGDAHQNLEKLSVLGPFDFVFIDAEKSGYEDYYDWARRHTHPGSVIAAHNAFRGGSILHEDGSDESTRAIRAFNHRVAGEPDMISTIFPAGDGLLVAVRTQ